MLCHNCNKQIDEPLELYTGEWACPSCKQALVKNSIALKATDENDELFTLSEICYLRALKSGKEETALYNELLNKAMDYCKAAARLGHPKAMVRMGYYYDYGYFSAGGLQAYKLACEYYGAVVSGKISDERSVKDDAYSGDGLGVKKSAAKLYVALLKRVPPTLRGFTNEFKRREIDKMRSFGLYEGSFTAAAEEEFDDDRAARVFSVFETFFSNEKAPLFGLLRLTATDATRLVSITEKTRIGTRNKLIRFAEKATICLFSASGDEFRTIKTERDLDLFEANGYYVYFFNTNGKHSLSSRNLAAIKRALEQGPDGGFARVKAIIALIEGGERLDYVFSEDDVSVHKSKAESFAHATDDLIDAIEKEISNRG